MGFAALLLVPSAFAVACDSDTEKSADQLGDDLKDEADDVNLDDDKGDD